MTCQPLGLPRQGTPRRIFHTDKDITMLYGMLVEPWVMAPRTLRLNRGADAGLVPERAYCEVYERENISTQLRH